MSVRRDLPQRRRPARRPGQLLGALAALATLGMAGCGSAPVVPNAVHLQAPPAPVEPAPIPAPVLLPPVPPEPRAAGSAPRYTVVVRQVPAQEILQAVARDAHVNIDIHPAVSGLVTLNAVDQTLPQILQRITRQTRSRYRVEAGNVIVEPDTPFLRNYAVDYVNATRNADAEIDAVSQVSSLSGGGAAGQGGASGTGSTEKIVTSSQHHFWQTLVQNLKDLLQEGPDLLDTSHLAPGPPQRMVDASGAAAGGAGPAGSGATGSGAGGTNGGSEGGAGAPGAAAGAGAGGAANAANGQAAGTAAAMPAAPTAAAAAVQVIANPEAGVISVRATSRQHEKVQEFLDRVLGAARRQVLIEATVVEVTLNDAYSAGIDWTKFIGSTFGASVGDASQFTSTFASGNPGNGGFALRFNNGNVTAAINLLDTFGSTRVLSSPKLMALNNQTALLKVVDNLVYFNITSQYVPATNTTTAYAISTATPRSVAVGLVMAVTPQISETGTVSLVVRPTISRLKDYVIDPTTAQTSTSIVNKVPEISVREMESILSVQSGQVAVLGGLMQQTQARGTTGVPGLGQLPAVGDLFNQRNDSSGKTELVVFLRPVIVDRQQPLPAEAREGFPDANFFQSQPTTAPAPLAPVPLEDRRS